MWFRKYDWDLFWFCNFDKYFLPLFGPFSNFQETFLQSMKCFAFLVEKKFLCVQRFLSILLNSAVNQFRWPALPSSWSPFMVHYRHLLEVKKAPYKYVDDFFYTFSHLYQHRNMPHVTKKKCWRFLSRTLLLCLRVFDDYWKNNNGIFKQYLTQAASES